LNALRYLSKEKVAFFIDNNSEKWGSQVGGVTVYSFPAKKEQLDEYEIVISVGEDKAEEIEQLLEQNGITSYQTYKEMEQKLIIERIQNSQSNINVYNKAINWIYANTVGGKAIINNTGCPKAYPEVTGYYIPTLLQWGQRDLAVSFARWLCSIQKEDGAWYDTDDKMPYVFDTAQILKGLLAVRGIIPEVDIHIKKGCNWILTQMLPTGRIVACDEQVWGDKRTLSELIHIYCLSPIREAGEVFGVEEYKEAAKKALNYYMENHYDEIMHFGLLSHFYAYVMEGLLDMGEVDLVRMAMEKVAKLQKDSGAVPAYENVDWVCSTGLFQFALVWFRLGEIERGERAFSYACKLQNESGGWFGSYRSEENPDEINHYLPGEEISWAVKYFLDALRNRNIAIFNTRCEGFVDRVDRECGLYEVVRDEFKQICKEQKKEDLRIADIGCGRGSYLKNLIEDFPNATFCAVDISKRVMEYIDLDSVEKKLGSLTCIPYGDAYFDATYACEALEHAVDEKSAIREMARVTKSGGTILIIDKFLASMGDYVIEEWEKYFSEEELKDIMLNYCSKVSIVHGLSHKTDGTGKTMSAWIGRVK